MHNTEDIKVTDKIYIYIYLHKIYENLYLQFIQFEGKKVWGTNKGIYGRGDCDEERA